MTTKNKTEAKPETAVKPSAKPELTALQKALNVINSYRAAIHKYKKTEYDRNNRKGFNNEDDVLFFKNLHNMWLKVYTEDDILDKKFNFGEGIIVFKDGQKYTVKKENNHLIIA